MAGILVKLQIDIGEESSPNLLGDLRSLRWLSHLSALSFVFQDLTIGDPFAALAALQSLQDLNLGVAASADPSPLSALTGLSSLRISSMDSESLNGADPFSFSSLQPLSALLRLEVLELEAFCCTATSLKGLAGLSRLQKLAMCSAYELESVSGMSTALTTLHLETLTNLKSLSGVFDLVLLQRLVLIKCGVASLHGLEGLSSLVELTVESCPITSLEGLEGTLSTCGLQSLTSNSCESLCQLSGIEKLHALQVLEVRKCGVTSLRPLAGLGEGLEKLCVEDCSRVEEKVLELPHVQRTADVCIMNSNVQEVVLAGGIIRRAV